MVKRRRVILSVFVVIALLLMIATLPTVYLNDKYFFNPLTFKNNDVLYLPWKWYTKPLNMQIFELSPSSNKLVEIKDPKQIKYVISELEKGSKLQAVPASDLTNRPTNAEYGIYVRTEKTVVLQGVYVYPKVELAEIGTQHGNVGEMEYVSLTPSLLSYINKVMGH